MLSAPSARLCVRRVAWPDARIANRPVVRFGLLAFELPHQFTFPNAEFLDLLADLLILLVRLAHDVAPCV